MKIRRVLSVFLACLMLCTACLSVTAFAAPADPTKVASAGAPEITVKSALKRDQLAELQALRAQLGQNAPEGGTAPVPDSAPAAQPEAPQTDTTESAPEPAETM